MRLQRECEELLERVQAMEPSRKMHELGTLLYTSLEPKNGAQVAGRLVSMMLQQQPIEVLVQACCDAVYRDDLEAKAKAAVHAQTVQHPYHPQQQHQRQQPQQQQQWRLQHVAPRHDENQTESQHGAPAGSSTPTAAGGSATEEGARLVATPGADDCNALKQHKETTAIIHVSGCPKTTGRSPGGAWTILYMDPDPDCDIPLSMELDVSAGHVRTSRSPDVTSTLALQTAAITDCLQHAYGIGIRRLHIVVTEVKLVDRVRFFLNDKPDHQLPYVTVQPKQLPRELREGEDPPSSREAEYRMRPYYIGLQQALVNWQGKLPTYAAVLQGASESGVDCSNLRVTALKKDVTHVSHIYQFCADAANAHEAPNHIAKE